MWTEGEIDSSRFNFPTFGPFADIGGCSYTLLVKFFRSRKFLSLFWRGTRSTCLVLSIVLQFILTRRIGHSVLGFVSTSMSLRERGKVYILSFSDFPTVYIDKTGQDCSVGLCEHFNEIESTNPCLAFAEHTVETGHAFVPDEINDNSLS